MSIFDRFKFPTEDAKKVGSWAFNILKPPVEDVATIGRALPRVRSPFGAIKKTGSWAFNTLKEKAYKPTKRYFEPTSSVRFRDILRQLPETGKKELELTKTMREEMSKSGGSLALSLHNLFSDIKKEKRISEYKPSRDASKLEQGIHQFVFGKEPVKSIELRIKEGEKTAKDLGFGKLSLPASMIGVGATISLDFAGFGGGKKEAFKYLAKVSDVADTAKVMRQVGVVEDIIEVSAPRIAKMKNADDVARAFDKIDLLQKSTKPSFKTSRVIHPEDKKIMTEFIDNVRLKKPQNINLELDATRMAEFYDIKTPKTTKGLANEFDKALSTYESLGKGRGKAISETKLLTTTDSSYLVGKGFTARPVAKRALSPKTRVIREVAKYRKTIAEKKLTDPLIARINKAETRKAKVRIARDYFGLTDTEVKKISKKDVGVMSDFEFKKFIDDFRIRAEEYADLKQVKIENIAAGYKDNAKLVKPEQVPTKTLSDFDNFVDLSKIEKKDIPYKDMNIAENIKGDKATPAMRRSGFFAEKEVQTANIIDTYSQKLSPHLMALKQDAYKKGGEFGTIFRKVWKPTEKAIRSNKEFNSANVSKTISLMKKHKIKMSKKNLEHLSDVMEGKSKGTESERKFVEETRIFLNDLRNKANEVRRSMGRKEIGYIEDYIPHMQKTDIWNELLANKATISDSLDFIIPNQTTNPFAYKRMLEEMPDGERNLGILLDRYVSAIGKDIHITPAIENIKAYNGVLKNRELTDASKYWDEYIRTGLIGKQHKIDSAMGIGSKSRTVLQKWNNMVNLAFLTGKVAWNIATQPLSYMMNVPMEVGIKKSITSLYKSFKKPLRQFVKENSNVLNIKSSDVHAVAVGEGRNIQNRIYRTKINKYNDFISVIGSVEERELTLVSYIAGLDDAKRLGYKGDEALWYADLTAARTQSMYNKENRALILNSDITRTIFPFQSFSLEMFNHLKEITTKTSGSMQLTYRQRTGKLMGLLVGLTLANGYSEMMTGKKKTTVGTFIPFIGGTVVDPLISRAKGEQRYGGRSPITTVQIGEDIINGAKEYIKYGTSKKLRKVAVNFGLALGGIGGGSQINNIIDGINANIEGDVKNIEGDTMFEVKDAVSKVKAPIFGVWATKEGVSYWDKDKREGVGKALVEQKERKNELEEQAEDIYETLKKLPKEQANKRFKEIYKENKQLAGRISTIAKEEKLGLTFKEKKIRRLEVSSGARAKFIVEELNKLKTKEEKREYYGNLIDKKIISKKVGEQIKYLLNLNK